MHWAHPDFKEGPKSFVEKRDPVWITGEEDAEATTTEGTAAS
jgi:hypothetical protein